MNRDPIRTARGIFSTRLKSSTLKVMPMPSMMTASPHVMKSPLNQVNQTGRASASAPPSSTQAGNKLVAMARARTMIGFGRIRPSPVQKSFLLPGQAGLSHKPLLFPWGMILPLVAVYFCIAFLLAWSLNWLALIPWRKSVGKHWTERARVLYPARTSSFINTFLIFQGAINTFGQNIQTEETPDKRSLKGLEDDINAGLGDWDARFKFKVTPMSETEVVTAMLGYDIFDETLKSNQSATSYGQGFQRQLIYRLFRVSAACSTGRSAAKKKDFSPDFTLLLFEEPEAFLHPPQQSQLDRDLRKIGSEDGRQVLISTHSPQFVSHGTENIPGIADCIVKVDWRASGKFVLKT